MINIKAKLDEFGLNAGNAIVIGSGILNALDLRASKDVDVVTTEEKYREFCDGGHFKKSQNHGREVLTDDLFEIGTGWTVLGRNWSFDDLMIHSVVVKDVRYSSVGFLLDVKRSWLMGSNVRQKDVDDVRLMEGYFLKRQLARSGDRILCPIAVIVKDDRVLTGYRNYTPDKWKKVSVWTIPGGRSDVGETVEQSLRREIAEEVGVTELEIKDFIAEVPGAKEGDNVLMFYCTTKQEAILMEPDKFSEWRWVLISDYTADQTYLGYNPVAKKIISDYLERVSHGE